MVFEHPLRPGESFAATSVNLSPLDRKNPPSSFISANVEAALGGTSTSGGSSGLGGAVNLGPRPDDQARKTPLTTSAADQQDSGDIPSMANMAREVQLNAMQQAAYVGASQAARTATSALKTGASAITAHVKANPYSVTVMSCIGGLILAASSLIHLIWIMNIVNPLPYILRVYEFFFGLLIIVIDGPSDKMPQSWRDRALSLAPMQTNTNRILFYTFIACLQGSLGTWFNVICGWYFAAVAVLFTIVTLAGHSPEAPQQQLQGDLPRDFRIQGGEQGVPFAQPH